MNTATLVVLGIVLLIGGNAIRKIYKKKKSGGCGCGCSGCSSAGICHSNKK